MNVNLTGCFLTEAELILHRMRSLHQERVEQIQKDESHVQLSDPCLLILHIIPEAAVRSQEQFGASDLKKASHSIRQLTESKGQPFANSRFNADGVLLFDAGTTVRSYSQLYRSGVFEGVMTRAAWEHTEKKAMVLLDYSCEDAIINALAGYLPFASALSMIPPFWMFSAIVGCEGAKILIPTLGFLDLSPHGIDRNVVWLPEMKVESVDHDPVKLLRPLCDALWNAVGFDKSSNFDEQGIRQPRRY